MADDKLEYEIGAKLSPGMRAALDRATRDFQRFSAGAGRALQHISAVARAVAQQIGNAMRQAGAAIANLNQRMLQAAQVGSAALTASLALLAKRGVEVNLSVAGAEKAIGKISGSAQIGKGFIALLRQEAETSASTFKDMLQPAQTLAAVFIEKYGQAGIGKVIPTLRAFADTASTLAVSADGQKLALAGFAQLVSEPEPTLENLKQVSDNLPGAGIRSIVRAAFGTDESEALKKAKVTGAMVGEAIVAGLRAKFDGAQREAAGTLPVLLSNIQDAFDAISAKLTTTFQARLTQATRNLLDFLGTLEKTAAGRQLLKTVEDGFTAVANAIGYAVNGFNRYAANFRPFVELVLNGLASIIRAVADLAANQDFMLGLAQIFRVMGNTVMFVAGQAANFAKWIGRIVSEGNVLVFMSRFSALTAAVGESFLKLVGIDLQAWLNPDVVVGFFQKLWEGVGQSIKLFFALRRTAMEVFRMMRSYVEDLKDSFDDFWEDTSIKAKETFEDIRYTIQKTMLDLKLQIKATIGGTLQDIQTVIESVFKNSKWLAERMGINKDTVEGMRQAVKEFFVPPKSIGDAAQGFASQIAKENDPEYKKLEVERAEELKQRRLGKLDVFNRRFARDAQQINEDYRRNMPWQERVEGAWNARWGDPAEDAFYDKYQERFNQFFRLYSARPQQPFVPPPRNPGSVQIVPQIENPAAGPGRNEFDYTPYALPNGQVVSRGVAAMQGLVEEGGAGEPGDLKGYNAQLAYLDKLMKTLPKNQWQQFRQERILPILQQKQDFLEGDELRPGEDTTKFYKRQAETEDAQRKIQEIMSGEAGRNDLGRSGRRAGGAFRDDPFGGFFSPVTVQIGGISVEANGDAAILRNPQFQLALKTFIAEYLANERRGQFGRSR